MGTTGWNQFKLFLERSSAISMDALHLMAGFLIFVLAAVLLKRSLASPLPWLCVLALELCNEAYDLYAELWPSRASQLGEGAKDILLTMTIPTCWMLLARWKPHLLGHETRHPVSQERGDEPGEGPCHPAPSVWNE